MGRRGPLAKPAETAQGHRARPTGAVLAQLPTQRQVVKVPTCPKAVTSRRLRATWRTYWQSEVAAVALAVDLPMIERLWIAYQRYEELQDKLADPDNTVTTGSQKQLVLHPDVTRANQLAAQILKLEGEIGVTPYSRARLGIAVGQHALTLQELNSMVEVDHGTNHDTGLPDGLVLEGEWEFL